MANMDIIVKQLNKETDLRKGIIKTVKKWKRGKPRDSNSKEMTATHADSAKNMLMCRIKNMPIPLSQMMHLRDQEEFCECCRGVGQLPLLSGSISALGLGRD